MASDSDRRWLTLIHQLPAQPNYLRVKVGRRFARLGAVAVKSSVYALPHSESTHEDLRWVRAEIVADGGDATLFEAAPLDGLSHDDIEQLYCTARSAGHAELPRTRRVWPNLSRRRLLRERSTQANWSD